jgi:hypothetical protein
MKLFVLENKYKPQSSIKCVIQKDERENKKYESFFSASLKLLLGILQ